MFIESRRIWRRRIMIIIPIACSLPFLWQQIWLRIPNYGQCQVIDLPTYGQQSVYYFSFSLRPFFKPTPVNIAVPSGKLELNESQRNLLKQILEAPVSPGKFNWFDTRVRLDVSGNTILLIDGSGGFLETESGTMGKLSAETVSRLQNYLDGISGISQGR